MIRMFIQNTMKLKYFALFLFGFIIGWNIFLIQRDRELFKSIESQPQFVK